MSKINKKELYTELMIGTIIILTLTSIFIYVDFFEWWHNYTRAYEFWEFDELFAIILATFIAGAVIVFRQMLIMLKLINKLQKAQTEIKKHEQEKFQQQKMIALGTLAGGLAHEINNTLQPTLGLGQFVRKALQEHEDKKHIEYMDIIIDSSKHARRIIDNVLLFASEKDMDITEVNFNELTAETLKFCQDLLPTGLNFNIQYTPDEENFFIKCNKTGFYQILFNLLKNASSALNQSGNIDISISKSIMPNNPKTPSVCIKISDEGGGMNEETLDNIFNPFFSTKDISEGSGLGLTIVYSLINQYNGSIDVGSVIDEGTTFTLHFPITKRGI